MRRPLILLAWLALFSALWAPPADAAGAEFTLRLWAPDLDGTAQVGSGGQSTLIDLGSDLGLGDTEALEGRLIWRPTRRVSLRLDYSSFDFTGDNELQRSVTFAGTTFQLAAQVRSVLDLEYGGVGVGWQFLSSRDRRLRFGPVVEARGLRGEAGLSADILGIIPISAREEFEAAFGAAGVLLDFEPTDKLHIEARWTTSVETDEGDLTDLEAAVRYFPIDNLAIVAGYRQVKIDAADGDERVDFELDGPFVGGVLRF